MRKEKLQLQRYYVNYLYNVSVRESIVPLAREQGINLFGSLNKKQFHNIANFFQLFFITVVTILDISFK